ncbi:hypothetical protein H0E87_013117 [Populus deltoides]|uniref:Uncharacterized protein n=1 Tax=Populus deltoides TaxID=3696 RepID=A0A8T2YLZ3_POPDE|nr:hypothetical protein H0E87_013117 [Populus deltoides]
MLIKDWNKERFNFSYFASHSTAPLDVRAGLVEIVWSNRHEGITIRPVTVTNAIVSSLHYNLFMAHPSKLLKDQNTPLAEKSRLSTPEYATQTAIFSKPNHNLREQQCDGFLLSNTDSTGLSKNTYFTHFVGTSGAPLLHGIR